MPRQKDALRVVGEAALVKEMRELCGLSIARTAFKADISAVWLNMFERGQVTLKAERVSKLVRVLRREMLARSKRMAVALEEAQQAAAQG